MFAIQRDFFFFVSGFPESGTFFFCLTNVCIILFFLLPTFLVICENRLETMKMMSWYREQHAFQKIGGTNGFLKMSPAGTEIRKKNASKGIIITKTPGFVRRISFLEPSGLLALYYPSKNILTPAASVAPGSGLKVESGDHRTPALK